jgi:hypothetical protein
MTHTEAQSIVTDAARQHRDSLIECGRLSGVADLLTEAIEIVESGLIVEQPEQSRAA